MDLCETLIKDASVLDGSGADSEILDIAIRDGRICAIGTNLQFRAESVVDAQGLALSPGFIDTHTHDDIELIRNPSMLAKVSQGVTTVIVGNCGISASPVQLHRGLPDPMNLLGDAQCFRFPTFTAYVAAIHEAQPAVNVAALVEIGRASCRERVSV